MAIVSELENFNMNLTFSILKVFVANQLVTIIVSYLQCALFILIIYFSVGEYIEGNFSFNLNYFNMVGYIDYCTERKWRIKL